MQLIADSFIVGAHFSVIESGNLLLKMTDVKIPCKWIVFKKHFQYLAGSYLPIYDREHFNIAA